MGRTGEDVPLKAKDAAGAGREARIAVWLASDAVQTEIALGDALSALNSLGESHAAYERALKTIGTVEPGARKQWTGVVEGKER